MMEQMPQFDCYFQTENGSQGPALKIRSRSRTHYQQPDYHIYSTDRRVSSTSAAKKDPKKRRSVGSGVRQAKKLIQDSIEHDEKVLRTQTSTRDKRLNSGKRWMMWVFFHTSRIEKNRAVGNT